MAAPPRKTTALTENSIGTELRAAGSRQDILDRERLYREFMSVHFPDGDPRKQKHGYAFRLSNALARTVADALRPDFPGILPDGAGRGSESAAPVADGFKKLDVNYSTLQLGLALGLSIKTLNFSDEGSGRFTKNATRIDNELRAEAHDYHGRQPYCVMVAMIFVPRSAVDDLGARGRTSFRHIYEILCKRAGRVLPTDPDDKFERIFLAIYESDEQSNSFGELSLTEVIDFAHAANSPTDGLTFEAAIRDIGRCYQIRNPRHRPRS